MLGDLKVLLSIHWARTAAVALLAPVFLASGGCWFGQDPPPPESESLYEPLPEDFCSQLPYDELVAQLDLALPTWFHDEEPGSYSEAPEWWVANCQVSIDANENDSIFFVSGLRGRGPAGSMTVRVFRDPQDASDGYASGEDLLERRWGAGSDAEVEWLTPGDQWDEALGVEAREEHYRPDDPDTADPEFTNIEVAYTLLHENLSIEARLDAPCHLDSVEECSRVVHGLTDALIEEAMNQLTLGTD